VVPTIRQVRVQRWAGGVIEDLHDQVADETPIALHFNGIPHVVMLATPADVEDLAVGFSVTEGIVARMEEIQSVEAVRERDGFDVHTRIGGERMTELMSRRRNLVSRSGCGLCGAETMAQAMKSPTPVGTGIRIDVTELHAMLADLQPRQTLNVQTGGVHAAAWVRPGAGIQQLREDVGRHNALDKVIGALLRSGIDPASGYLLITSRGSYEMVQKAAAVGISLLVAVSAPTALAIRLAEEAGVTLIGFARAQQHVVYSHGFRIL
jgi:FdhD protein